MFLIFSAPIINQHKIKHVYFPVSGRPGGRGSVRSDPGGGGGIQGMESDRYWVGGGCRPNFIQKLCFACFCRLPVRALGRPNGLNPTVPRVPLKIPCWIGAQNPFSACFVDFPCQALVAPFIILSGSHSNAHQNCVF